LISPFPVFIVALQTNYSIFIFSLQSIFSILQQIAADIAAKGTIENVLPVKECAMMIFGFSGTSLLNPMQKNFIIMETGSTAAYIFPGGWHE